MARAAERMGRCGNLLTWATLKCTCGPYSPKIVGGDFCGDRLCAQCAHIRGSHWSAQILDQLRRDPGLRVVLLTLTWRSIDRLDASTVSNCWADFTRLRHRSEWAQVRACAASLEFTHGDAGWHPHLHALVQVRSGGWLPDQAAWSDAWSTISGAPIVDIRPLRPGASGMRGAVAEVAKYCAKPSDVRDPALCRDLWRAIRGRRLTACTGAWWGRCTVRTVQEIIDAEWRDLRQCPTCGEWPRVQFETWLWDGQFYRVLDPNLTRARGSPHLTRSPGPTVNARPGPHEMALERAALQRAAARIAARDRPPEPSTDDPGQELPAPPAEDRHRVILWRTGDGIAAHCACSWESPRTTSRAAAERLAHAHLRGWI